ncbi:CAP domain-containing protein [Paraburkholderia sp. A3RO-2L]|uniref:CAP domain-containing protein n=1 Tax=Paraburkholderia sp. A3RO-2L TaxID=3028376 RepID=UPI003DA93181
MNKQANKTNNGAKFLTSIAFCAALAACGGGGGSSTGSNSNNSSTGSSSTGSTTAPTSPSTGNVSTPQYSANSAQQAIFNTINQQRQQCGFPTLTENTVLDKAAQAHASYMGQNNGAVTDSEVTGNPGFTGVSYADRAAAAGFPRSAVATGVSAGYYTNATLSEAGYGQQIAAEWLSGVYHVVVATLPATQIGVGWNELTYNGFPEVQGSVTLASIQPMSGNLPLTYPCEGTTDVPYKVAGEVPTPPNVSDAWGPSISVAGNPTDTIRMTSATLTDSTSGSVINLQVLDSSTDTTGTISANQGRAYPTTALGQNTKYTATVNGTYNGTPFSRTFSYTTGTKVG